MANETNRLASGYQVEIDERSGNTGAHGLELLLLL